MQLVDVLEVAVDGREATNATCPLAQPLHQELADLTVADLAIGLPATIDSTRSASRLERLHGDRPLRQP